MIARHFRWGVTFRWTRGDSYVAVKPGYVMEGKAEIIVRDRPIPYEDRPNETPGQDQDTWIGSIRVKPDEWSNPSALREAARQWAGTHSELINPADDPHRPKTGR